MTSMHGTDPNWMLTHTYDIKDLRKINLGLDTNQYTLSGLIQNTTTFSLFNFLLRKAKLEYILDDLSTNFTLFIPCDDSLKQKYPEWFFVSIDYLAAKEIILSHIVNRRVTSEMLSSSDGMQLSTNMRTGRFGSFYCGYDHQSKNIIINNRTKIIDINIMLNNGIIHVIDDFIFAPDCSNN